MIPWFLSYVVLTILLGCGVTIASCAVARERTGDGTKPARLTAPASDSCASSPEPARDPDAPPPLTENRVAKARGMLRFAIAAALVESHSLAVPPVFRIHVAPSPCPVHPLLHSLHVHPRGP